MASVVALGAHTEGQAMERREQPYYDTIHHGRMWSWLYLTSVDGEPDIGIECFTWMKPTKRSRSRPSYRYSLRHDMRDAGRCLEDAFAVGTQLLADFRGSVPIVGAEPPAQAAEDISFSPQEVAGIRHLLLTVRTLGTESPALWELEQRACAALDARGEEQNTAVTTYEKSQLYADIEAVRKRLTP